MTMAVSCPEVMYGAYYPYLYGRAGPSRTFYQYERFNQDLYSSPSVQLASSSASGSSHSPCSPILPPSVSANAAVAAVAAAQNTAAAAAAAVAAQSINTSSQQINDGSNLANSTLGVSLGAASTSLGAIGLGNNTTSSGNSLLTGTVGALHNPLHSRSHTKEEEHVLQRADAEAARLLGSHQHHHHHNESSCSSGPDSPHHLAHHGASGSSATQTKDLPLETASSSQGRAQYLSATCVVFTNYSGDTNSVVDEHFSRALNFANKDSKDGSSPMSARNFPPSFWNSNYVYPVPASTHPQVSDLYGSADAGYATDPWVPAHAAAHYGSYAHAAHAHAAHAHAYHHNMAQYGSLLRLPQQYASHGSRLHHDQPTAHALESAAAYTSYPTMAGLEGQDSSKDLYWF